MHTKRPFAAIALSLAIVLPTIANAQRAQDLVGTWQLVSNTTIRQDGSKADIFGATPKGLYIFTSNGHFAIVNMRPDLPKFRIQQSFAMVGQTIARLSAMAAKGRFVCMISSLNAKCHPPQ